MELGELVRARAKANLTEFDDSTAARSRIQTSERTRKETDTPEFAPADLLSIGLVETSLQWL